MYLSLLTTGLLPPPCSGFLPSGQIRTPLGIGRNLSLQHYSPANSQGKAGRQQRQMQKWQSVCITEVSQCFMDIKNSGPHLIQFTPDSILMPNKQSVAVLKHPGVINSVMCGSVTVTSSAWGLFLLGLVLFHKLIASFWTNLIILPNSHWFSCSLFWLDALYPDCISTKLTVITGGYYPKLKQPLSSEDQYKISGWLWSTSLHLVIDFCLQVSLLQLFLLQRNWVAYCCLQPISDFKVTGNNFRSCEKQSLGQLQKAPRW